MNKPIYLFGNPNCGKTTLFNQLTGLNQKISNYPGITVEKKIGSLKLSKSTVDIVDLPGTYSLNSTSIDEKIVIDLIKSWFVKKNNKPEFIISIVDASNLARNLFLTTQLIDTGIPVVLVINKIDMLDNQNEINVESLKTKLGVLEVILMSARNKVGVEKIINIIDKYNKNSPSSISNKISYNIPEDAIKALKPLSLFLEKKYQYTKSFATFEAMRCISNETDMYSELNQEYVDIRNDLKIRLSKLKSYIYNLESSIRYQMLNIILSEQSIKNTENRFDRISNKLDSIFLNQFLGPIIFLLTLYIIFQSIFSWSSYPMELIDSTMSGIMQFFNNILPNGILKTLFIEGVLSGIGAIVIFVPQIFFLIIFFTALEDSGYMARIAYMFDKVMFKLGLSGKSILPLMSGYACAIPGIIGTRTIQSWKERLTTILVLPLISCQARIPIYVLLIGTFIPESYILGGWINLQSMSFLLIYVFSTIIALIVAKIFSLLKYSGDGDEFILEMPKYQFPQVKKILVESLNKIKIFIVDAGKIILAISIVLWFLASYPKLDNGASPYIENSYAGRIGHFIEPAIKPLGFDWKIGIGLLTSFAAREVMVSTLTTVYNIGDESINAFEDLKQKIKNDYNIITGMSLLVFYMFAAQCMATVAVVKRETNSWYWTIFMIVYMNFMAYSFSYIVYNLGNYLI